MMEKRFLPFFFIRMMTSSMIFNRNVVDKVDHSKCNIIHYSIILRLYINAVCKVQIFYIFINIKIDFIIIFGSF